jgi:D-amino-acid dehydrogenase
VTPTADIVVIGGGLLGAAAAFEAASTGATTVLVDRHDPGRATDAGAGILSAETTGVEDPEWFAFAMGAAAHYRTLVPRLEAIAGIDDGAYAPCGLLCVALHEPELPWYEARVSLARSRVPDGLREVTGAEARAMFPPLAEPVGALYSPFAARVDGRLMSATLQRAAAAGGARRLAADVTGLDLGADRVLGVTTSAGPISCGAVVIAGGAWSPRFGAPLRVELPVTPMKGQIVHLQLPTACDGARPMAPPSAQWPIVQPVANHYLVPWPDGRVVCGGTLEPGAGFDDRPTASGVHELLREALRIAPGLGDAALGEVRVGLRPMSADGRPILGRVAPWANVFVATGHGTEGLLLGPLSGRLVALQACQAAGRSPVLASPDTAPADTLPASFSPARFSA